MNYMTEKQLVKAARWALEDECKSKNLKGRPKISVAYEQRIEAILSENDRLREALKPIRNLCNAVLCKRDGSDTVSLAECLSDDDTFAIRLTLAQANDVHNSLATPSALISGLCPKCGCEVDSAAIRCPACSAYEKRI